MYEKEQTIYASGNYHKKILKKLYSDGKVHFKC